MTRNRLCLRILWLCSVLLLVIHINSGAGLGQSALTSFDDYRACPRHQRVAKPEHCELGVAWFRMTTLLPGFGAAQPDDIFVTVIIKDCTHVAGWHVAYSATFVDFKGVSRACDLEIAVALTRQDHVISDICRLWMESTRTSTWDSNCPARSPPAVQSPRTRTRDRTRIQCLPLPFPCCRPPCRRSGPATTWPTGLRLTGNWATM